MNNIHINKSRGGACATETTTINPNRQKFLVLSDDGVRYKTTFLDLKSKKFADKLLCDGITLDQEYAIRLCNASKYVGPVMSKVDNPYLESLNAERRIHGLREWDFENVVIPQPDPVGLLREQLLHKSRMPKFTDPDDNRVIYVPTFVDVAATMELMRETAWLCNLILDSTAWQIRLLSNSNLLARLFKDKLIPERHRHRVILGFSTGTLDDSLAGAIEYGIGTARVSERIEALHWLQDEGYRTFGMVCPSLPQFDGDYVRFSREICEAIRVDRCEHVWSEVIDLGGKPLVSTLAGLHGAGFKAQAEALSAVMGQGNKDAREQYDRATFLAHTMHVPAEKLRFLQNVDDANVDWWAAQRVHGAVLLGKAAKRKNLTHVIG